MEAITKNRWNKLKTKGNMADLNHTTKHIKSKWFKHMISFICGIEETKQRNREKKRQNKKQTLNCKEQTDGYRREGGWGRGKIGDGD